MAGLVRLLGFTCSASKNLVDGQQYGEGEQYARDPGPAAATQLTELSVIAEVQTEARSGEPKHVQAMMRPTTAAVKVNSLHRTHAVLTETR